MLQTFYSKRIWKKSKTAAQLICKTPEIAASIPASFEADFNVQGIKYEAEGLRHEKYGKT